WLRFKVGRLVNFGSWVVTGHRLPSAWIGISYQICCTGEVSVTFSGSYVPSQYYYVDWKRERSHDMLTNTLSEVKNFMLGDSCQDAPGADFYNWKGSGYSL